MSAGTLDDDAVESDPRLLFIYRYLSITAKFKVDKWQKMMNTEVYKNMIMDFLEKPQHDVLIVTLTSAGALLPSLTFPTTGKTKSSYFARVKPEVITAENIRKCLIFGDVSPRPIDDLAVLVEEVFVPVFSNPANHKGWPAVVVQDVKKHVIELKNMVYKVRAEINGQTLLPMPDGVSRVHQVEQRIIHSNGEDVDLQLKSAIEGAVIKWVNQITDILQETPISVLKAVTNPLPHTEIDFWRSRLANLECIYDQLTDPRVKKMASILELTDSAYYPSFRTVFRNVVAAVKEAKEISKYLKPVEKRLSKLEAVELGETEPLLRPLLHTVSLVWAHCPYYCSSAKLTNLLQLVCNMLIDMANKFLDPTSLFQGEVPETIVKVHQVISLLETFKNMFEESRAEVVNLFPEGVQPVPWLFHSKMVFKRLNSYLERLTIINEFFDIAQEYSKLEKVEVGGLYGRHLGAKVAAIFDEFNISFNVFRSVSYDPAEPEDPSGLPC